MMARMLRPTRRRRARPGRPLVRPAVGDGGAAAEVPRHGVTHERAQFARRSSPSPSASRPPAVDSASVTVSTMPTMAASTGAALRRSASPAARPSSTISTRLADARADRVDRQQRRAPRRAVERQRLDEQQLRALRACGASAWRRACRRLDRSAYVRLRAGSTSERPRGPMRSTIPTTQASTGGSAGRNGNDASWPRTKNTCSPTPAPIASAATSVRPTGVRSGRIGCRTSSLWPCELRVLDGRDDVADHARKLHVSPSRRRDRRRPRWRRRPDSP